jgi:amino acid adenylation domain-containing protein
MSAADAGHDRVPVDGGMEARFAHELVEAQAGRTPDAVAASFEGESLTYRELDRRANQLARHLRRLGVRPEAVVGICMERSLDLPVAILGVLKAGGACMPLDPAQPIERLAFMLDDARPPVLLTQERLRARLPAGRTHVLFLDAARELADAECAGASQSGVVDGNLAFVFYTSGSTGRPKAVMQSHRRVGQYGGWRESAFGLTADDRHLLKSSIGFTVFLTELFWGLQTGGRVIVAGPGDDQDGGRLVRLVAEHGVTILHVVPSLLRVLLDEPGLDACRSLRHVVCIGEAMPPGLADRLLDRLPVELSVVYGTTEAPTATHRRCVRGGECRGAVTIGRPLPDKELHVLDESMRPVPEGVAGELYVGGRLSRGYLGRPALTAERFVPNPFGADPGARLYRTHDLVRVLTGGEMEFLGRRDDQIKLRGMRVELGEIQVLLQEHPGVREAAVVARDDQAGERRIAAYYAPEPGAAPAPAELRAHLAERLPAYMVPWALVPLDRLPRLPSGKVDRRSLPAPAAAGARSGYAPPRTPLEETIVGIWADALGAERVGVDDDFFELGGHSLLATRIATRIREAFAVELPLRAIFEQPTVGELADHVQRALDDRAGGGAPVAAHASGPTRAGIRPDADILDDAETDRLLAELEALSDDDARRLLERVSRDPAAFAPPSSARTAARPLGPDAPPHSSPPAPQPT